MAKRRIRLLHLVGQIGVGGCETQLLEFCRRIASDRYELGLCYWVKNPDSKVMIEEFDKAGVKQYYVDKFGAKSLLHFFVGLRKVFGDFQPDITQCWMRPASYWGRMAAVSTGYGRRMFASDRGYGTPYGIVEKTLEFWLRRKSHWMCNSHAIANRLNVVLGVPENKISTIYNAVELPQRDRKADRLEVRRELGLDEDQPIILKVGRLNQAKNHPMLFRAAARVLKRDNRVRFVCAGHGEEEGTLRSLLAEMKLENQVLLLGLRHDVPRLLNAADIFCFTSDVEGFPNGVAEALATGLPIVCTRFEGADEIVHDGETGVLVDKDDDENLAETLVKLMADGPKMEMLSRNSRVWAQEHLSWARLVDEMDCLYQKMFLGQL